MSFLNRSTRGVSHLFRAGVLALAMSSVQSQAQTCSPADLTSDGVLDFFDVAAFLNAFSNEEAIADFSPPAGSFDFFDVQEFLRLFAAGCNSGCEVLGFSGANLPISAGQMNIDVDGQFATYQLSGTFDAVIGPDGHMVIDHVVLNGVHIQGPDLGPIQLVSPAPGDAFLDPDDFSLISGQLPLMMSVDGGEPEWIDLPLVPDVSGAGCNADGTIAMALCSETDTSEGRTWLDWFLGRTRHSITPVPGGGNQWCQYAVTHSTTLNGPLALGSFICIQCVNGSCPSPLYVFEPNNRIWAVLSRQNPDCTTCPANYNGHYRLLN